MSTDPATTSQVQAYRFMLRRMESALVRKDAVMLHEPMRHHLRAMVIGVILALLGLAAFFVIGRFSPVRAVSAPGQEIPPPGWVADLTPGGQIRLGGPVSFGVV